MVRIKSDGSIDNGMKSQAKNPIETIADKFWELSPQWKVVVVAVFVFGVRNYLNGNPLADGKIPAADLRPDQHWNRIAKDDGFVRTMTEHLGSKTFWEGRKKQMTTVKNGDRAKADVDIMLQRVDFGGPDGHVAERGDWSDLKYVQGTRCATTRSALTAYFCGAEVAGNQDRALGPLERKHANFGVQEFANFLTCRHQQGETSQEHRRSVYRIGIGCKESLAGYSHAYSIIAQPDGTFYWLQSFIGHYSLPQWMNQMTAEKNHHLHKSHLTLEELLAKLKQVERLMNIQGWTAQANQDYFELFGVDKEKEAMQRNKSPVVDTWKTSHRLQYFYWDEACTYPVPQDGEAPAEGKPLESFATTQDEPASTKPRDDLALDQCAYENLLQQLQQYGVGKQSKDDKLGALFD